MRGFLKNPSFVNSEDPNNTGQESRWNGSNTRQVADMFTAQTVRDNGIMTEPTTTCMNGGGEKRRYRCGIQRELYSTEEGGAVHRILHSTGLSVVL